jgi:hypothetical protein
LAATPRVRRSEFVCRRRKNSVEAPNKIHATIEARRTADFIRATELQ